MWTVRDESPDSPDATALLRAYFTEIVARYNDRPATEDEVDETLAEFPTSGLAAFFVLRAGDEPAGCLGLHPTGELTRAFVLPRFRRQGGARALLAAAEDHARAHNMTRLHLDTRTDLEEARALYTARGFTEIPPPTTPGPYQDHWFEKRLD
jgi:GNAT superfamily N-acetyltransferase